MGRDDLLSRATRVRACNLADGDALADDDNGMRAMAASLLGGSSGGAGAGSAAAEDSDSESETDSDFAVDPMLAR